MTYDIDYNLLPADWQDSVRRYVERGISGGGFLDAVFANDLDCACRRADAEAMSALPALARFLRMTPRDCWGDHESVLKWCRHNGLAGRDAA